MMSISYESSDGYSGSELEFDQKSTSNYSAGDMSISFDNDGAEMPPEYYH